MADTISSIASAVAGCFVTPIGRQVGYLFYHHSNVEDLKNQLDKLKDVRVRIKRSVSAAKNNVEVIETDVDKWLKRVDGITEKAEIILREDEDKAKKRCLNGLCPNLKSRYWLSRKAKKTTEKVAVEIHDGEKFGKVSYHPTPHGTIGSIPIEGYETVSNHSLPQGTGSTSVESYERVSNRLPPQGTGSTSIEGYERVSNRLPLQGTGSTSIEGYENFESRMSTLKEIMEALRNPNINMIGVYGMGGVGKTMLVKEAARKARENKLFDKVVVAVVSQPPNERKIQEEIASPLGLRFDDNEIKSKRVERLCKRLNEEKSILIILDDVWAQLDLKAIGIPLGDKQNGCKIVVTSRRLHLFSNQMDIQNNFKIKELHEEEAWNFFKKMAGDSAEAREIKLVARKVAKECAGLPIAIAVVATALKNKRLYDWKYALNQLEKSAPTTIEGMDAKVYSSLKLSYDFLESEAQNLFLLCSLLPEDYQFSIQELLYYGKGFGLFQGIQALELARISVHALVDHLSASCLLLDGDTPGLFKMHDVVRDVGIFVASKKQMLIVRNSDELEDWPTEEKLGFCSALSLPYSDIHELPQGLKSPQLKYFLFFSKDRSSIVPDTFFEEMKKLRVLTLRRIHFSSLHFPSSLQTLCLDLCQLPDISIIGELKKLEILSFRESNIKELPREIGQLTRLKLLDLTNCHPLKVILPNVIASLTKLEELYMANSFGRWEGDGNASLAELKHLSRLVTLEIYIPDPNILPNDLVFEKLKRYRIYIGEFRYLSDDYEISRTLNLAVNTSIHLLSGRNQLLKRTKDLHLEELNGFKSDLNDSDGEGFRITRHLLVESSSEIEYVIDTSVPFSAFPNLESLSLVDLIKLKEICHGQFTEESFSNLRKVEVIDCDRLQNLLPLSVARRLSELQEIIMWRCKNIDGIVAEGREAVEDNNGAVFPQLRSLTLGGLPKLVSFCGSKESISISEGEHGTSIPLFNEKVAFPNLEKLELYHMSSMKVIWQGQFHAHSFCKLRVLKVEKCDKILKVFPITLLRNLQNLEELSVEDCCSLKDVFELEGGLGQIEHASIFPPLRKLRLIGLPKIMHLWKEDSQLCSIFQNLTTLEVRSCESLTHVFTSTRAEGPVQIESTTDVSDKREAMDETTFSQLYYLELKDLPNLTSFCLGNNNFFLPSLKKVFVEECPKLKTFSTNTLRAKVGESASKGGKMALGWQP